MSTQYTYINIYKNVLVKFSIELNSQLLFIDDFDNI